MLFMQLINISVWTPSQRKIGMMLKLLPCSILDRLGRHWSQEHREQVRNTDLHICGSRGGGGGTGGPDPLKNHKKIRFLSNTGPDPLKNQKATKPAFNVGPSSARQRNAI